jgi:C4-dicarboxylate-specific signal transduction histidine kinase
MSQKRTSFWRLFNFRDWRISTKILVLTLMLSLIPLILATGLSIQSSTGALTQQTRINLSRLSFSTAQRIEQFLLDNHNFIRMAASTPAVIKFLSASTEAERADLQEGVDTVVANVLSSNPAIDLVGFYDTQGIVLSHNEASIIGRDYSFRDYVQTALAGAPFTSGIQVGWTTDVPGINASSPVKRDDEVIGAIATRIQGKFITDILISTLRIESEDITEQEREAIDIFLINEYGIIVSHSNESSDWLYHSLGVIDSPEILETIESVRLLGGSCPSDNP